MVVNKLFIHCVFMMQKLMNYLKQRKVQMKIQTCLYIFKFSRKNLPIKSLKTFVQMLVISKKHLEPGEESLG